MNVLQIIFIVVLTIASRAKGEPLACQDFANFNEETQMCDCGEGRFYNAWEGKCQGICGFYGNTLCSFNSSDIGICVQEFDDSMNFTCTCPPGFFMNENGFCSDEDQCSEGIIECPDNEQCYQLNGADTCTCTANYYRAPNGVCYAKDICKQSGNKPCDQICTMWTNGTYDYTCECFSGYKYDGGMCIEDPDSEYNTTCTCDETHPEWAVCYINSTTEEEVCNAVPGFRYENGNANDIDECAEEIDQCSRGFTCKNLEGSYECICDGHYDPGLNECFGKDCSGGLSYYDGFCLDPCSEEVGFTCPAGFSCYTNEQSLGECKCQISCQLDGKKTSSSYSVYNVSFVLPDVTHFDSILEYSLVKSMEIMFGAGNSELLMMKSNLDYKGTEFKMSIGISNSLNQTKLQEAILNHCYNLTDLGFPGNCLLPNGITVAEETILVATFNSCEHYGSICAEKNAECRDENKDETIMPGIYRCLCSAGYQEVFNTEFFYCEDIDECRTGAAFCTELGQVCQNTNGSYACVMCCEGQIASLQTELYEATQQLETLNEQQNSLNEKIDDEEKRTAVVGGTLGALLGVALVALLVVGVYIFRQRSS